jgi:hypothetical protein
MSSTVLKQGPWQIVIHTDDHTPAHVHVRRASNEVARVQLVPVELWDSYDLNTRELGVILAIIGENQEFLLSEWDKYHPNR